MDATAFCSNHVWKRWFWPQKLSINAPLVFCNFKKISASMALHCKLCTFTLSLKGKFPLPTMWIEWVESNFINPTVKVWAELDNPFKRSDYATLCMSPSLDGTLPEYVISQEDNSPLTLYIDFTIFKFSWISILLLIKFFHECMHIHLSPNIPTCTCKYKRRGKIHFHEK